jgi:transcription antitermination factor NusG
MGLTNWFVARVVPQAEIKIRSQLYNLKPTVEALVPTEERYLLRSKRKNLNSRIKTRKQVPILPGYVFVKVDPDRDWDALKKEVNERCGAPVVFGRVGFSGKPARLTESDLEFIRSLSGLIESRKLTAMVRVGGQLKVVRGVYEGQTGPVLKIGGKERGRVKTMMSLFGRMSVVEMAMADVEAAA